jgi:hypothetical protein
VLVGLRLIQQAHTCHTGLCVSHHQTQYARGAAERIANLHLPNPAATVDDLST